MQHSPAHRSQLTLPALPRPDRCRRCGGLTVPEPFLELDIRAADISARRCVQCGDIVDPVILENRLQGPGAQVRRGVDQWRSNPVSRAQEAGTIKRRIV
jgi:hypothetical protein